MTMTMTTNHPADRPGTSLEADEREIRDLLTRYCEYVDTGDILRWADCYTDDAVFAGLKGELKGREALLQYGWESTRRGFFLHFLTNVRVQVEGGSSASASSYLLYTQAGEEGGRPVIVAARQRDRLVRQDGRWRLSERRIEGRPVQGVFG